LDDNDKYLHWDKFRWKINGTQAEKEAHWKTVKLLRQAYYRETGLESENGMPFQFLTHSVSELFLHQIDSMGKGTFANFSGDIAPPALTEKFLVSSLLMEEAITGAQLEGASTTRDIAKKMLEDKRTPLNEDERMILNNYLLLKHANKNKDKSLSIELILEFHKIATVDTTENAVEPGELRVSDDIAVYDDRNEIVHQPPHHSLLEDRLKKLCDFANAGHFSIAKKKSFIHPVIKAVILHFMIGYEHPFRDGNGRTARALFYWYMLK
ncbi:Fic family protein, partial [Fangia hongkongensis]